MILPDPRRKGKPALAGHTVHADKCGIDQVVTARKHIGVEFAVTLVIGAVSLFADSVDFLEDASVNLLIVLALGWSSKARACLRMALAFILFIPGIATVWTAIDKFAAPALRPSRGHDRRRARVSAGRFRMRVAVRSD
jgi:divalent metal cation (Fe/Co/Zn/Cd) transporter